MAVDLRKLTWWGQGAPKNLTLLGAGLQGKAPCCRVTGGGAGRGDGRMWGEENEKTRNGIAAPRKMVLLAWLQVGLRFALRELSPAPSQRTGNLETPGG